MSATVTELRSPNLRTSRVAKAPAAPSALYERVRPRPLLVAVPLYRRPELARQVVDSITACADEIGLNGGEVVLYNDSPDDLTLSAALADVMARAPRNLRVELAPNPTNLGFVKTANRAIERAVDRGYDLVLLNSDTVLTPGALTEMARVALADPMIGFVNPRSNNATLATLPYQQRFRHLPPAEASQAWRAIAPRLPAFSYAPTANGFCMLIRWAVLAEFGGFDEIYGRGYNEENDLVMRAGRRGYRAVLANHAFVWHEGSASFGLHHERDTLEQVNREVLLRRYPEYPRLTDAYFASPEQRAELILGALIPDDQGRLDVALDFSSFVPAHNGTFAAGLQLLGAAVEAWSDRFNVYVLCAEDSYQFHEMGQHGAPCRDPHGPEVYAAIFRVGQPYDWGAVERLALKAASFGVFMLDTISLDCGPLYDPEVRKLWTWTLEHAELIAATSALTADQIERRFTFGQGVRRLRSLHSLDLQDYALPPPGPEDEVIEPGYIFVVGNHYWHKDVAHTVNALCEADPTRRIVVLGGGASSSAAVDTGRYAPCEMVRSPNVVTLKAGGLTAGQMSALYAGAAAVVAPSHYEGFGMAVLNALSARRPVFARPLPVVGELWEALGGDANLHIYLTTADLLREIEPPPTWNAAGASPGRAGDAARAARDVGDALGAIIAQADYGRIVRRLTALPSHSAPVSVAPATPEDFVAHRAGALVERLLARLLKLPGVFDLLRRSARACRRLIGRRPAAA